MSPRQTARLPFVVGLDRASSALVVSPAAKADVRNLYSRAGTLALRSGMTATPYPALAWGTDVIGIGQLQQTKDLLYVVFDRVSRDVRLYRVNPIAAPTLQAVLVNGTAKWGTLDAAASFPHVTFAEQAGALFLAHDEPVMTFRFPTIYYQPNAIDAIVGTATTLTADLDGDGTPGDVKFRGVVAHTDALWGWGFGTEGTASEQDQQHIVHVSVPGDPFTFPPENYFLCGAKSDPVMACVRAGNLLAVRKPTQGFRITGTSAADFAVEPTDALFGGQAARLAIAIGTDAYVWTNAGPRRILADGTSVDISLPLDLAGPSPATLAAMGVVADGFAVYDPATKVLEFCFPDVGPLSTSARTRCYALSLSGNPAGAPEWTYYERGVVACCAAVIDPRKGASAPVNAIASAVSVTDGGIAADGATRALTVGFTQAGQAGDEQWQIFLRRQGTLAYTLATTVQATTTPAFSVTIPTLPALAPYDVAIRAYRSGVVATGYESADPAAWTAASAAGAKGSGATSCAVPTITTATWQRTSPTAGQIAIVFALADTLVPVLVQSSPDGVAWTTITTLTAGERTAAVPVTAAEIGTTKYVRVWPSRTEFGVTTNGTATAATAVLCGYAGVASLVDAWASTDASPATELWVANGAGATLLQVQGRFSNLYAWEDCFNGAVSGAFTRLDAVTSIGLTIVAPALGYAREVRVRSGLAGSGGAADYGPWSAAFVLAAVGVASPGPYPSFAIGAPPIAAPRTAQFTIAGIAALPGSRLVVLFNAPGATPVAVAAHTTDGAKTLPLPTSASGQTVIAAYVVIDPSNIAAVYGNGVGFGVCP